MRIALLGYGKMGQMIQGLCQKASISTITVDPGHPDANSKLISPEVIQDSDVAIDFTTPDVVLGNISTCLKGGLPIVVGTTGWYDSLDMVTEQVEDHSGSLLWGSNFSIGVHLFFKALQQVAPLVNRREEYDISALEMHHREKADSPSGTALSMAEILLKQIERKDTLEINRSSEKISKNALHLASLRCGAIPGTHRVLFDSPFDTITIEHTARSREGFAAGSIEGAKWLAASARKGIFRIEDVVEEVLRLNA